MSLYTIVYVSIATQEMSAEDLKKIFKAGRANNEKAGITGMLLYRDGFFLQVIEGEEAQVDALYKKVIEDSRHTNHLLIYKRPIEKRAFSEHLLSASDVDASVFKDVKGFSDFMQRPTPEFLEQCTSDIEEYLNLFKS